MSVDSRHPDYDKYFEQWQKCAIVQEGEEAVKDYRTKFLPKLDKQTDTQYAKYLMRALFYNAVERTIQGLVGAVFAKQPIFHLDGEEYPDFYDSLALDGIPFIDLAKNTFSNVLNPSRVGLLADAPEEGDAYITKYDADSIINWDEKVVNGTLQLTQVVLHEHIWIEGKDKFEKIAKEQWRVLELIEINGAHVYQQELYVKNEDPAANEKFILTDTITPKKRGVPLSFIPFVIINPSKIGAQVEKPICIDMVNVNLSHYRSSADLEHGRHFTGLPTAWVAGFDPKRTELIIGSTVAWVSQNPHANAGFLEFTGQGLQALENALRDKEKLLTILGARILEGQKDAVENAETQKVRRLGENSILANIADTVSVGLSRIVQIVADWRGKSAKVRIELNKEYTAISADAQTLTAMISALQQGAVSFDTWFFNLKKWQMVPPERVVDDELALIEERQGVLSFVPPIGTRTPNNASSEGAVGANKTPPENE